MARKKLFWEPYVPFMSKGLRGHRNEALALALAGALVTFWGFNKVR